ncbi:MAG: methyltransferase domain-containing protein [Deltaproteobacteria bacterium]|nr:methyltransferase domain-containing protein [Deltaproteobacteria bacterium]
MLTVDFDRLELVPGMAVLDAGCGPGRHAMELLQRGCRPVALDLYPPDLADALVNLKCTWLGMTWPGGLDGLTTGQEVSLRGDAMTPVSRKSAESSQAAAQSAAQAATPAALPWLVLRGDTLRLPFASGAFPRVICSEVLEHVDDPAQAAAELARVAAPGGIVAVSVPTPYTERVFGWASDDYFNTPGGHVRIFTPRTLAAVLEAQGLHPFHIHFEHSLHSVYWGIRAVFGLHHEAHWAVRGAKRWMEWSLFSPFLRRVERGLNWVIPKAMVLYARKNG